MNTTNKKGTMCISLDFELYWGMTDVVTVEQFRNNAKQTKEVVIPKILECFKNHCIHATWATVGGIMADGVDCFNKFAPNESMRPTYMNPYVSTYCISNDYKYEDMFYSPVSVEEIKAVEGQEIGSHTFSHYYCTEAGQTVEQFGADLDSAVKIANSLDIEIHSIVFPRNQMDKSYIRESKKHGFWAYRSIEDNWIYNKVKFTPLTRALRLMDSYFNLTGANCFEPIIAGGMVNIPGSRLFRPYNAKLAFLEKNKINRIKKQMLHAAETGKVFHLWWHPHNFSTHTDENIRNLEEILNYYDELQEKYGFQTKNMGEIAEELRLNITKTYHDVPVDESEEAANIYNMVFDEAATDKTIKRKHFQNPAASKPQLHGAYDEDKLIGINGFLDMTYRYKDITLKAVESCDTAVDPFYRNQGIFTSIIMSKEKMLREQGYDLIVGYPNFNSYPGFLKMGWEEVTRTGKLFLPVHAKTVIKHMVGKNLPSVCNIFTDVLWHAIKSEAKKDSGITLEAKKSVSLEEYKECVDTEKIHFEVDEEMLKWKFADLSYHYVVKLDGKKIGRVIAADTIYKDQLKRTNIICYSFDVEDRDLIKNAFAKVLMELGKEYDLICMWGPTDVKLAKILKELHFLDNIATKQGSPFIVKIFTEDPEKIALIRSYDKWNPNQIETDTMVNL